MGGGVGGRDGGDEGGEGGEDGGYNGGDSGAAMVSTPAANTLAQPHIMSMDAVRRKMDGAESWASSRSNWRKLRSRNAMRGPGRLPTCAGEAGSVLCRPACCSLLAVAPGSSSSKTSSGVLEVLMSLEYYSTLCAPDGRRGRRACLGLSRRAAVGELKFERNRL